MTVRKLLSLALALALLLALAACGQTPAPAPTAAPATPAPTAAPAPTTAPVETPAPTETPAPAPAGPVPIPAVGDEVEGFVVQELRDFPLIGATLVRFEHKGTGAELLYIANSDTNRAFDLTFRTRAIDNTGLPHVFEHATTDGSDKYPPKSLFFNLCYQTYNTYMNAYTVPLFTSYPVASLSEAQLLKYADYYTDSCLHPRILNDERIFREEAWRYRMADMDAPLTIEGTVYSEMRGAMDLHSSAALNLLRAAFPGSTIGNEYGGEPEHIPEMTFESLRGYHDLYYHPSNCIAFLYGEFEDYTAFLKLLDEAFAPFEKKAFSFEDPGYEALTESVTDVRRFPTEEGSDAENASAIYYAFVCPGLKDDPREELVLNTLTDLLAPGSSPLMQALKRALPSGQFATYIELDGPEDLIVFYGANLNEDDAETFRATVDASLASLAETGFSDELIDGIVAALALETKLVGETDALGVNVISSIASYYASTGNLYGYMDYADALDRLRDWNADGLYTQAISDWLLADGVITVLSVTSPEPGLREVLDREEELRLAEVKAGMDEDELQKIIDATNAEEPDEDASEYVKALQAVTVSSLPEELRIYDVSDRTGEDGVRRIDAVADVDGVGNAILLLDASALPQEDIHWFALYTALLGEMDTVRHDREALALLTSRYLYSGEIRLSVATDAADGAFYPRLRASWIAADEDLAAGYDLMYELLYETDFSDAETLRGLISRNKAAIRSSITGSPYSVMLYRAIGADSPMYRYYSYFNGVEYYAFLEQVELLAQDDPAAVAEKLGEIAAFFHNRHAAVALYAGSAEGVKTNAALADAFMAKLEERETERAQYAFEPVASAEALIVDSNVQYNGVVAPYAALGLDGFSGAFNALASVVSDSYLYPMLRDRYGAYDLLNGFLEDYGAYIVSYRDPNVAETFDVYDALPDFLKTLELDQEALDGYILSAYVAYAQSSGELSGAVTAALDTLTHEAQERHLEDMRALKALTPARLREYAAAYEKMMESGRRFTAGGAAVVDENADRFESILNPFGAVDSSEVAFEDVAEDHPNYDAVRFVFEYGLLEPVEENRFGVGETATLGDLAWALYAIGVDVPTDAEAALAFLAEYGILPDDRGVESDVNEIDVEDAFVSFSRAAQLSYKRNIDASAAPLTRGELAEMIMAFTLPLLG